MDQPHEEAVCSNSNTDLPHLPFVKGKRTKRPRSLPSPPAGDTATSSTSTTSYTTEEDEDMANCLILLARGPSPCPEKFTSRRFAEAATTTSGKARFYVYECKTCSKCFPSFQALGGHRTSHKKPRLTALPPATEVVDDMKISMNSFPKPVTSLAQPKASKVHECSICGSEFMSGQALGGHMRRHRPAPEVGHEGKKEKGMLLDLNMPAPAEEEGGEFLGSTMAPAALTFAAGKRQMLFPATAALVGCHYFGKNTAVV